jgi:hypothetical protein
MYEMNEDYVSFFNDHYCSFALSGTELLSTQKQH